MKYITSLILLLCFLGTGTARYNYTEDHTPVNKAKALTAQQLHDTNKIVTGNVIPTYGTTNKSNKTREFKGTFGSGD